MTRGKETAGAIQSYRIRGTDGGHRERPTFPGSLSGRAQALVSSHRKTTNPLKEGQGGHGCVWGGEGSGRELSGEGGWGEGEGGFLWG